MKTPLFSRRGLLALVAAVALAASAPAARAQYFQIASQLPSLIQPALSGSMTYRGFVEASGLAGFGENRANFLGVSTSQGFQYADWFFMGAGLGVDAVMAGGDSAIPASLSGFDRPEWVDHPSAKTKAMIPVFSDFRFNIPTGSPVKLYAGVKLGAAWLLGDSYLLLQNGRMSGTTQFYFRPSVGARIPVDRNNPAHAFTVALTYQLLTSGNNWSWYGRDSVTLSSLGLTISYEFGR